MIDLYIKKSTQCSQIVVKGNLNIDVREIVLRNSDGTRFSVNDTLWFDKLSFEDKFSLIEEIETAIIETVKEHLDQTREY